MSSRTDDRPPALQAWTLARRGVVRPHLASGPAVGAMHAMATLPVWRGEARRRLAAWDTPVLLEGEQEDD